MLAAQLGLKPPTKKGEPHGSRSCQQAISRAKRWPVFTQGFTSCTQLAWADQRISAASSPHSAGSKRQEHATHPQSEQNRTPALHLVWPKMPSSQSNVMNHLAGQSSKVESSTPHVDTKLHIALNITDCWDMLSRPAVGSYHPRQGRQSQTCCLSDPSEPATAMRHMEMSHVPRTPPGLHQQMYRHAPDSNFSAARG